VKFKGWGMKAIISYGKNILLNEKKKIPPISSNFKSNM